VRIAVTDSPWRSWRWAGLPSDTFMGGRSEMTTGAFRSVPGSPGRGAYTTRTSTAPAVHESRLTSTDGSGPITMASTRHARPVPVSQVVSSTVDQSRYRRSVVVTPSTAISK
jgi:hypothetical protein